MSRIEETFMNDLDDVINGKRLDPLRIRLKDKTEKFFTSISAKNKFWFLQFFGRHHFEVPLSKPLWNYVLLVLFFPPNLACPTCWLR